MNVRLRAWTIHHPILAFYSLNFVYGLPFLFIAYVILNGNIFVAWIGTFGPAVAALVLTAYHHGHTGLRDLLAKLFLWRVGLRWYLVILLFPLIVLIGNFLLYTWIGDQNQDIPLVSLSAWLATLPRHLPLLFGITLLFTMLISGEEIGWRGYAQPILQTHYGPLKTSVIIGVMWGLWHIPAMIDPSYVLNRAPFYYSITIFTLSTILYSIIYTWLWNNTQGSLLIACLFHAWYDMLNQYASLFFPFFINQYWLHTLCVAVLALALIIFARPFRKSREHSISIV